MDNITFITTGGTIDKDYASGIGTYDFTIAEPVICNILDRINPNFGYQTLSILKKDSLDITPKDRQLIFDTCQEQSNDKIIITHGTDTMVETAKKLSSIPDKTIVLVGSIKPEKLKNSDASFNIGCAIGALNILPNGIYVAMNGRIYDWNNCIKNEAGQFTTIG